MLGSSGLSLLVTLLLVSASPLVGASWFAGVLASFPGLAVLRGLSVRYTTILLFSRVVALAEKAGKHVDLLVVPSSDIFQAIVQTAAQLESAEIIAGRS